jgi:tape measure domain-containing protein
MFGSSDTSLSIVLRLKDEASAALKTVESRFEHFQRRMEPAVDASKKFALAMGGAGAALGAFGLSAIKAAANAEQTIIAFETMLGSAENAKKFYNDLVQFAAKTPFELTGLETASKQLLAYGFAQEEVLPQLKALGDIAAGVGMDKLPQLILAFGQVKAATKLTGMELRQFTEAGVPMLDELSKILKEPVARIQEMVSEGEIGFPIVQQALQNLTGEGGRFNNLMEKQAKSLGGMWSNLKDAWEQFLRGQGAQLIEWAKQFVAVAIDIVQHHLPVWIEKTKELTQWLGDHKIVLATIAGIIVGALVPAVMAAVTAFASLVIALAPFAIAGGALFMFIQGLREGNILITAVAAGILTLFIPALAAAAATILTTVIPAAISMAVAFWPFLLGGVIIAGLVAGIMYLIQNWELVKAKAAEIWGAVKDFIIDNLNQILFFIGPAGWAILAVKLLIENWGLLAAKTSEFWGSIKDAVGDAVDWILAKLDPLISAIGTVKGVVSSVGSVVGSAVSSVASVFKPKPVYGPIQYRASGGPVSAGQPYMVGEQGPELFLPRSSGSIVPNHSLQGSRPIVMNFHFNDAVAGDDGIRRIIQATINQLNRDAALRAIAGA